MKTVALVSLGCSKNQVDAEHMLGSLVAKGYKIVKNESDAKVLIVNTCCFIEAAQKESIEAILDLADYKNIGKCEKLVVTGCMAERYQEQILEQLPEVDAVIGIGSIDRLPEILEDGTPLTCGAPYAFPTGDRIRSTPSYMAYLKIADGCDNHCTYCVIPSIRGRYQSKPIEDLVAEAKRMAEEGVKELVIIAQDTTCYGMDLYGEPRLCQLLEKLCSIEGIKWIRVHYCYPERITDELLDLMAKEEKICNYLDIPIQHCNDRILKLMGRKTNKEEILSLLKRARERVPGIVLRTSLIAGFPSETEEEYKELEEFIRTQKFERLGVFAYSREEDTPAYRLPDQLDEEEKERRAEMLRFAQDEVGEAFAKEQIGKELTVLTEGYDDLVKQHYGRTTMDSEEIDGKVFFRSSKRIAPGEFVTVKIEETFEYDLFGEVVR